MELSNLVTLLVSGKSTDTGPKYGQVRTVAWQGSAGDCRPDADHVSFGSVGEFLRGPFSGELPPRISRQRAPLQAGLTAAGRSDVTASSRNPLVNSR
jgi:hypothetical protein